MRVGILYGGKSTEHEVSVRSAVSVYEAIDHTKHEVVLININKEGNWLLSSEALLLGHVDASHEEQKAITVAPGEMMRGIGSKEMDKLDVIFPVLHGTSGEDGSVQGLLQLADVPYVGCNIISSAMCMDKDVTKKMLHIAGLNVADGVAVKKVNKDKVDVNQLVEQLGLPLFIKPANQGSSVGVTRVDQKEAFKASLDLAFKFDNKVLIEKAVAGREIEVAVLGNDEPIASVPGEIVASTEFYSYESKYIDENGAALSIPADLTAQQAERIRDVAVKAYQALDCSGMARVDVFLTDDEKIIINEINTLPGFTSISMYPKLFEVSGIPYTELIDRLLDLAVEAHGERAALVTDFSQL